MNSTSLSTWQNVCITAELFPDCTQVRDPMVWGRNLKSLGPQLWSLSRQLQCLTHFQIPSPAAFCCHLCANVGQQNCWIWMFSSAWGTAVQILAVHPNPTLISIAHFKRQRCRLLGIGSLLWRRQEAALLVMSLNCCSWTSSECVGKVFFWHFVEGSWNVDNFVGGRRKCLGKSSSTEE